ncbi:MAG: AmmeMemoRadiSam system protein A [Candidatus Cloacimonetes bacterium]|nr:AmmeMemoRadiSam system protein A [Candidatus Cloacimonadota bacterium]
MLNDEQKRFLLRLARHSIRSHFEREPLGVEQPEDAVYQRKNGAFVTLHKQGNLRGCIGHIVGHKPLFATICEMALAAAFEDPRFPQIRLAELDDIDIEISILSPLEEVTNVENIEVGKHGLLIQRDYASGLLLPQVATEWGWDRQTFLQHTCQKAGLAPDSWQRPGTRILSFEAVVFGEKELGIQNSQA